MMCTKILHRCSGIVYTPIALDEIGFSAASYTFQEDEGIGRITIAGPIFPSSIFFVQISGGEPSLMCFSAIQFKL